jgi:hypothetical protein
MSSCLTTVALAADASGQKLDLTAVKIIARRQHLDFLGLIRLATNSLSVAIFWAVRLALSRTTTAQAAVTAPHLE